MFFPPVNIQLCVNFSIGFLVKPLQIMTDLPTSFYGKSRFFSDYLKAVSKQKKYFFLSLYLSLSSSTSVAAEGQ